MTTRFAGVGTMGQFGFFDADRRLAAITAKGDPLEMIEIGLQNLAYNIRRLATLERMAAA